MNKFVIVMATVVALAVAQPAKTDSWKSTSMDSIVEQTKSDCARNNDDMACMKFKVLNLLDQIFRKDNFKVLISFFLFFFLLIIVVINIFFMITGIRCY